MMPGDQTVSPSAAHASAFHKLHRDGLLLLPNAWDAGSARVIESVGARAIATTSAAVCWAHGYPDGADRLPIDRLVATVRSISRVVRVPVTVDIEGGYSDDPAQVAETVARVIDAGGVGINLEDGLGAPDRLAAKIERAKEAGVRLGVHIFVNARADVFLHGIGAPEDRVDESIQRGQRYRAAGADGLFVPGITEPADA
jgi:2-methylisocitrate lyase-like PEP mutase family enzyme